jgi:hypothetical protein
MPEGLPTTLAQLDLKLDYIKSEVSDIKSRLEKNYVTQDQFSPVRNLVYGMVGVVMVSFIAGLVALLWRVAK